MSQREFAERGDLAVQTVHRVESGKIAPRGNTLTGLDKAAGWPPGTARAIYLEGASRPPSRTEKPQYVDPVTGEPDREAIIRRMIELVPLIRKNYGDVPADKLVREIMELASQGDEVNLVSTELGDQMTERDVAG